MLLALVGMAHGAEVTKLPPFLRGDLEVSYQMALTGGTLSEGDVDVARSNYEEHRIHYGGAFGVAPGAAVFVEMPSYLRARQSYADANEMIFDPNTEQGSMATGSTLEGETVIEGEGFGGVWIGARGTPFSEQWTGWGNRATWLLEVAVQTADSTDWWSTSEEGRGAGPGGPSVKLRTAFSKDTGTVEPWFNATADLRSWNYVTLQDTDGENVNDAWQEAHDGAVPKVYPSKTMGADVGIEITTSESAERASRSAIDLHLGFDYHTWADVPSGLYLPDVLPSSQGTLVTQSEYMTAGAGLGIYFQVMDYLKFDLAADVDYVTPHRLEHPYQVSTGADTIALGAMFQMEILIRTPES